MPRSIKFENIENFRDLGGYCCDFGETRFGVIYRSASLAKASKADMDKMVDMGIKTVIDLRGDAEQAENPLPHKQDQRFKVIELEVNGKGRISHDYEDYLSSYMEMLEDPESARKIFRAIIRSEKPLVFHCNAGKDRTGVFSMMLLALAGVDMDDINGDYMLSFPHLPKMTKETRAIRPWVPELLLTPDIRFVPDFLSRFYSRYGSAEKYLEVIGMEEEEIDYLKNVLGKHEKSCGAVVFRGGKILIEHMKKGHYSLPKGHVEDFDEDEKDTARREIKEETGIDVEFIEGFRHEINYSHKPGKVKRVVFFLAEAKNGEIVPQKEEVMDAYFLTPEDCMLTLTYESERRLVYAASHYFASH